MFVRDIEPVAVPEWRVDGSGVSLAKIKSAGRIIRSSSAYLTTKM